MVGLSYTIATGSRSTMACGTETAIRSVQLDQSKGMFRCRFQSSRYVTLQPSSGSQGSVTCDQRTRRYHMSLQPSSSESSRGKCMDLKVESTDGFAYRMEVQFSD